MSEEKEFKSKGFLLYTDDEDFFRDLDDDEAGQLIKALFRYFNRGETPSLSKIVKMPFNVIRKSIDRDTAKYVEDLKGRSRRRKKQWEERKNLLADASNSMQVYADASNSMETKTKTKTKAKAEAKTKAEALAKTKTKKTEVDASLGSESASPPSMEETYGKSNGDSVFHTVINKMLDERSGEDVGSD